MRISELLYLINVIKIKQVDDDDFTSEVAVKQPETIVFGEPRSGNPSGRMTKVQVKAFMVRFHNKPRVLYRSR